MDKDTAKKSSAVAAGVVGAGIGAAVGAAAVIMSDKQKREQLVHKAQDLKDKTRKAVDTFRDTAETVTKDVQQGIEDGKEVLKTEVAAQTGKTGKR